MLVDSTVKPPRKDIPNQFKTVFFREFDFWIIGLDEWRGLCQCHQKANSMFGAFKRLFSKPAEPEQPSAPPAQPQPVKPTAPPSVAPAQPKPPPSAVASAGPPTTAPMETSASTAPEGNITLSLAPILAALPPNLAALAGSNTQGTFSLPAKAALAQLASGAVKITFGELRQGSPRGTFQDNATQDRTVVSLPLAHVLSAIDPALLTRRATQKVVVVPESVTSIFGKHQSFSAKAAVNPVHAAAAAEPAIPAAVESPIPVAAQPVAPKPDEPAPTLKLPTSASSQTTQEAHSTTVPAPAATPGASHFTIRPPAPTLPTPAAKLPGAAPLPGASTKPPGAAPQTSAFAKPPGSSPLPSAFAKPPGASPLPSIAAKSPAPAPMPFAAPKPAPLPMPVVEETEFVVVSLAVLKTSWPPPVQAEIEQFKLADANVSLPLNKLDAGMKTGRVVFAWKELAQYLQPTPAEVSPETGGTALELPLSVIAPLFLARRRPGVAQKKVSIAAHIPDLFAGGGTAAEAPAPVSATATPAPSSPAPAPPAPAPVDALGEIFGQPGKSHWPPPEIIQKICVLKGVAGSALTMSDGLLLAGQIPAPLQPETIVAFVPQIFGHVNQSAGEMQLGALTSVVFTAGAAQCAIYKTGKLYLAVLGRPGEPLPEAVLERIAAELAKRNP